MDVDRHEADEFLERWPELGPHLADARLGAEMMLSEGSVTDGLLAVLKAGLEATRLADPSGRDGQAVFLAADAIAAAAVDRLFPREP